MSTTIDLTMIEDFLAKHAAMHFCVGVLSSERYRASCYWPNGDTLRDKHCFGAGYTIAEAVEAMEAAIAKAEAEGMKLTTAAECKAAVLDLIREHDAAPESFRDAVDALPVKG